MNLCGIPRYIFRPTAYPELSFFFFTHRCIPTLAINDWQGISSLDTCFAVLVSGGVLFWEKRVERGVDSCGSWGSLNWGGWAFGGSIPEKLGASSRKVGESAISLCILTYLAPGVRQTSLR